MLLNGLRVSCSYRWVVSVDACIGDDDVETGDSLVFKRGDSVGGVRLGLVIDLDDDEFAGRVLGDGGKLLRCRVLRVANGGDDDGGGAGEVGLDEAETDAWVLFVRLDWKETEERSREGRVPLFAPVIRIEVGFPAGMLIDMCLASLVRRWRCKEFTFVCFERRMGEDWYESQKRWSERGIFMISDHSIKAY